MQLVFNVNNMEIIQGIVAAAPTRKKSPLILQVSAGARKYASDVYLMKLVGAAYRRNRPAYLPASRITALTLKSAKLALMAVSLPL